MKLKKHILLGLFCWLFLAQPVHADQALSPTDRVLLQSYALDKLQELTIDSVIYFADAEKQLIVRVTPTATHPMVFQGNNMFVLCFEGLDETSRRVPIDVYVVRIDDEFKLQDIRLGEHARHDFHTMLSKGMFSSV